MISGCEPGGRRFDSFRARTVRLVFEHHAEYDSQWAAMGSIAAKIGLTAETLRKWVRRAERDQGLRDGLTTSGRERLKALGRENRELKRAIHVFYTFTLLIYGHGDYRPGYCLDIFHWPALLMLYAGLYSLETD